MSMVAGKYHGQTGALLTLYGLLAATGVITYLAFRAAGPITRRLGARGERLITQGLGLVLIAVGAKFLVEALHAWGAA
jgi:small neutral amino acid transporter SnatA (MarC family)